MSEIQQNTLYLLTPGSYVARDHLTLRVEVPVYPEDLPVKQRNRDTAIETRKLSIPIHHLESICLFGPSTVTPPALDLCWENGVAVNFLSRYDQLHPGSADLTQATLATLPRHAPAAQEHTAIAGVCQHGLHPIMRASTEP